MPSLFEPQTATAIITRINQLQPTTQRKWGKMTAYEWGFSQWKHFDHHLNQFGV